MPKINISIESALGYVILGIDNGNVKAARDLAQDLLVNIQANREVKENQTSSERIAQVQSDLFTIREDMRDSLDDAKDARFIRLCAELDALAVDFILLEEDANQA